MKILQLCLKPPSPAKDGGCIAMKNIAEGLLRMGHKVKIFTISTHKHPLVVSQVEKDFLNKTRMEGVYVETRVNLVDAFSSLVTQDSYNVSRFFSPDFDKGLQNILQNESFDIVHLESLFMTPYAATVRRFSSAKVVLRSHNLEYMIWERLAHSTKGVAKRAYLKYLSRQLKKYEFDIIKQMDGVLSISKGDQSKYEELAIDKPIVNIPFSIDLTNYEIVEPPSEMSLFHLGSLDWTPNIEGVIWFFEEVWPQVLLTEPDLKFYLAGRNIPANLSAYPNVKVIGEVADAKKFMQTQSVMVVPLLSAGGIRVKIIEGMAMGKNVITTKIGAEGIDVKSGKELHIANNAEEFVAAIKALKNPETRKKMSEDARSLVQNHFASRVVIEEMVSFYKKLLVQ